MSAVTPASPDPGRTAVPVAAEDRAAPVVRGLRVLRGCLLAFVCVMLLLFGAAAVGAALDTPGRRGPLLALAAVFAAPTVVVLALAARRGRHRTQRGVAAADEAPRPDPVVPMAVWPPTPVPGEEPLVPGPRNDPTSEVPWGRPPLPEIPLPPFASAAEHVHFLRCLGTHLAASGGVPVQRNDMVLLTLVEDEAARVRRAGDAGPRALSALALRVALRSYLPAPWTPRTLADALTATGLLLGGEWIEADAGRVRWGSDPDFTAERAADGSWHVTRHERGSRTAYAHVTGDDDLVLLLIEHHRAFPFPLAHRTDGVPVERLVAAATRTSASWARHARLPYLTAWTETVERVRAGMPTGEPGERA
jgi:hypothetical protein